MKDPSRDLARNGNETMRNARDLLKMPRSIPVVADLSQWYPPLPFIEPKPLEFRRLP